jgi:hypothetical protein
MKFDSHTNNALLSPWLPYLVFFTGSFIYFGFFGDYVLFFQEKSSLFIFSKDFLMENLHQPGALLIWLGKLISTFFYSPLTGAFIIAAILSFIVYFIAKSLEIITGKNSIILPLIIGSALFYLTTDYLFLAFNILGLLLQVAIFYLSVKHLNLLKGWIPIIISPLWYYATGGFSWIFIFLFTFYFAFYRIAQRWLKLVTLWSLLFLMIYISKEFLFFQSVKTLLTFPSTELNAGFHRSLFFSVIFILSILPLIARVNFNIQQKFRLSDFTGGILTTSLLVLTLLIAGMKGFDKKDSQYFHVEKLFYENKFNEVTEFLKANPSTNSLTMFLNNISLCNSDKLNDQLFSFPQNKDGSTLFLKWEIIGDVIRRGGYFYYTTGMINEAHRWAFENMVMKGLSPEGLKMLIKTELINGNIRMASKYINLLKKTIFYRKEALSFEKLLYNDNAINADPELGEKRRTRLKSDFFSITDDPYINIERVLATDSLNKKAFEYKIAFLLLKKDYSGIAYQLTRFGDYGYTKLPLHVEEAAAALSVFNKGNLPDLGNLRISKETALRWEQYLTVFQQYGTDPKASEPPLRKQFGNTFWYWAFYK